MSKLKIMIVYAAYLLDRCVDGIKSLFGRKKT